MTLSARRRTALALALAAAHLAAACGSDDPPAGDAAVDATVDKPGDASGDTPADAAAPSGDGAADAGAGSEAGDGDAAGTGDAETLTGQRWYRLYTPGVPSIDHLAVDGQGTVHAAGNRVGGLVSSFEDRDRTSAGSYRSADLGATWEAAARGLGEFGFTSFHATGSLLLGGHSALVASRDGGRNWARLHTLNSFGRNGTHAGADGDLIFAASDDFSQPNAIRSADGGKTFTPVVFREPARRVGAVAVRGQLVLVGHEAGLQRSTDGGVSFLPVVIQPATSPPSPFVTVSRIVIQDDRVALALVQGQVIRSEDGGVTWQASPLPTMPLPALGAIAVDGKGQVLVGGMQLGGAGVAIAWRSTDAGKSWQPLTLLPALAARAVAFAGGNLLVGTERGLQVSSDGKTWKWSNGPDSGPVARSMTRGVRSFVIDRTAKSLGAEGDLYVHDGQSLWRSTDGARSWTKLPFPAASYSGAGLHVTASGALMCGSYRSVDHGLTWIEMQFIGRSGAQRFAGEGPVIYALAPGLWRSDDDGLSWTQLPPPGGSSSGLGGINLVVNREGVVFHGSNRSLDKGMNWQAISTVISYVDHRDRLYAVNREWVSVSTDGGMTMRGLNGGGSAPAWYPSVMGQIVVSPDDRLWAHVDVRPSGIGQMIEGDQVHATTVPAMFPAPMPGAPSPEPPMWKRMDDGLEQANIMGFQIDRMGRVYAATNGGLYRFNP